MEEINNDIQQLQKELEEIKAYPIKLSWKQLSIIAPMIITALGSAFGLGIKTEYETSKINLLKQERNFQQQLANKEDHLIELNRKLKEVSEDNIYYLNKYSMLKDRLDKCTKGINVLSNNETEMEKSK